MNGSRPSLAVAVDFVVAPVLAFALHLLLVGHDEPGGGFSAGLVVAGALAVSAMAHPEREGRHPRPESLLGLGLAFAVLVAMVPMLTGAAALDHASTTMTLPLVGKVKLSSVFLFDVGVLLVVVGLVQVLLDRLRKVLA